MARINGRFQKEYLEWQTCFFICFAEWIIRMDQFGEMSKTKQVVHFEPFTAENIHEVQNSIVEYRILLCGTTGHYCLCTVGLLIRGRALPSLY